MSVKLERLNSHVAREISMILMEEVKDSDIKFVTITGVDITNDLSYCKVDFTVLDQDKKIDTLKALKQAGQEIRSISCLASAWLGLLGLALLFSL